jgi:hypothetical protein
VRGTGRRAGAATAGDGGSGGLAGEAGGKPSATAVMDGAGDPKLDHTLRRHGFEVGEGVAPKLCLGLQEFRGGGGGSYHGMRRVVLSHALDPT